MLSLRSRLRIDRDRGASAVEYAVLLSAIAAVVVFVVFGLGGRVRSIISETESCIGAKGVCTSTAPVAATPSVAPTTAAPTPAPTSTRNNGNGNGNGNGNCGNNGGDGNGQGNSCNGNNG